MSNFEQKCQNWQKNIKILTKISDQKKTCKKSWNVRQKCSFTLYLLDFLRNRAFSRDIPHCESSFQRIFPTHSPVFLRLSTSWLPKKRLTNCKINLIYYPAIIVERYFSRSTPAWPSCQFIFDTFSIWKLEASTAIAELFCAEAGTFLEFEMNK